MKQSAETIIVGMAYLPASSVKLKLGLIIIYQIILFEGCLVIV